MSPAESILNWEIGEVHSGADYVNRQLSSIIRQQPLSAVSIDIIYHSYRLFIETERYIKEVIFLLLYFI